MAEGYWTPGEADRWWEVVAPADFDDQWTARQVVAFHNRGDVPCAMCSRSGLVCPRLTKARELLGL